jgi:hypothetical protein
MISKSAYGVANPCLPGMLGLLLLVAGCAGLEPGGTRPDPASIRKILFRFAPENLEALPAARRKEMAERVSRNLGTWGYAVEADESGSGYSHVMEATIGRVALRSTPAGFSFTMGNSDPRAMDFQKADVLPVDCVLYPAGRPKDKASLYMDFIAGGKLKDPARSRSDPAVAETFVNHAATVCFNLLDDLKVRRARPAPAAATGTESASGSTWFPEVRIEVREKAPTPPAGTSSPAPAGGPVSVPRPPKTGPAALGEPPAPAPQPESEPETPPVSAETSTDPGSGRKEMIIHNQGNPIILEFGYERK